ncbi:MAG: hypothetical protein JWO53_1273 [Chlamydiia bacterium]|nr:hypothetical protein [Chlamydiia bacterium]
MTQKGLFELDCRSCKNPILFTLEDLSRTVACKKCHKAYGFGDEKLKRQLKQFEGLCRQIQESKEILGNAAVAVTVGKEEVKIPFKLLLSRLQSTLDLQTSEGEKLVINFRIEPATQQ